VFPVHMSQRDDAPADRHRGHRRRRPGRRLGSAGCPGRRL
jgi:hypothetical protein